MTRHGDSRLQRVLSVLLVPGIVLFLGLVLSGSAVAKDEDKDKGKNRLKKVDFAEMAREQFERIKDSTALKYNWDSILSFAASGKGPVLQDLIDAYKKPPAKPHTELRYLLATGIRLHYISEFAISGGKLDAATAKRLASFASKDCAREQDAWAAFNALRALASGDASFTEAVREQVDEGSTPLLRAAAAEALGRRRDEAQLEFLESALTKALKEEDKSARVLLVESLTWAIANTCAPKPKVAAPVKPKPRRVFLGTPKASDEVEDKAESDEPAASPHLARLKRVLTMTKGAALLPRTQRQLDLALQYALGAKDEADMNRLLRVKKKKEEPSPSKSKSRKRSKTYVAPPPVRFMGLEAQGDRVLFILDASDSMLKPLSEREKEILRDLIEKDVKKKPEEPAGKKSRSRSKTVVRKESRLKKGLSSDWDKVNTRFDAARAHLKHTLWKMDSATTFAVLLFGTKSELLKITPKFIKASDKARLLVARELDRIKAGPKNEDFPYGRLRGQTNLYSAFDLAFRVTTKGVIKKGETYVDDRLLTKGADAFFLLSDGYPTIDGFKGLGPVFESDGFWSPATKAGTIVVTDPETGATKKIRVGGSPRRWVPPSKGRATYQNGPFITPEPLVDDVRRRNLFLRVAMHVVGFGEADVQLLERLAAVGRGRWVWIGEDYTDGVPGLDDEDDEDDEP